MKTPVMMIINPAAGRGGYKKNLPEALKMLSDAGCAVSVFFTERRGHATELAAEYGAGFEKLLVLGGDGTLAEAIAGLMSMEIRPQVGYSCMLCKACFSNTPRSALSRSGSQITLSRC